MRVLLVHNYYRSSVPSGENINFDAQCALLAGAGHELRTFTRHSDDIERFNPAAWTEASLLNAWNPFAAARLRAEAASFRPDVVHVENTFPLISPAVFWAISKAGLPVVAGCHNYRLWCAAGVAYRDGAVCRLCLDRSSVLPGLAYACYKGSRLATIPVSASIALHKSLRTYSKGVDVLIANSGFLRDSLIEAGGAPEKIRVNPNFIADPAGHLPWSEREHRAVFVGRLGPEKGVADLVRAWLQLGPDAPMLDIIGEGSERLGIESLVAGHTLGGRIRLLGRLPYPQVSAILARSKLLIFPSRWYETFGRGVVEAYAHGVPVLAAAIGALPELIEPGKTGDVFMAGDTDDLLRKAQALLSAETKLADMAMQARAVYLQRYAPAAGLARLESIYAAAIERRQQAAKSSNHAG